MANRIGFIRKHSDIQIRIWMRVVGFSPSEWTKYKKSNYAVVLNRPKSPPNIYKTQNMNIFGFSNLEIFNERINQIWNLHMKRYEWPSCWDLSKPSPTGFLYPTFSVSRYFVPKAISRVVSTSHLLHLGFHVSCPQRGRWGSAGWRFISLSSPAPLTERAAPPNYIFNSIPTWHLTFFTYILTVICDVIWPPLLLLLAPQVL